MNALIGRTDVALIKPAHSGPGQAYVGLSGRTRTERVRVFRTGREPVEAEVFRVVNVEEYPELRAAALDGSLHRLEDGETVEVPFIYHDPSAQQFALVIPHAVRGRELSERARLLDSLMNEQDEQVPDYVRHFSIVYGQQGLVNQLEDSEAMEVDLAELEPLDTAPLVASYYPRLAAMLPPAEFWEHASTDLAPLVDEEELWLFAELAEDEQVAFSEASSDLLLQLKTVDQLPVCVLALIDSRSGTVRRAYLNPSRSADGRLLELLRRDFHAQVVISDRRQRLLRSFRLEAPRAANAQMILARTERAPRSSAERWAEVADACRLAPPSIAHRDHPFALEDEAPNAGLAWTRLRRLEAWSSPERTEEALLVVSVPRTVFELSRRRIVADACRFGLALSDSLLQQAVRFGLGANAQQITDALRRRFDEIVPLASEQGLDLEAVATNYTALERLSRAHGTSTGPDVSCTMEHSG